MNDNKQNANMSGLPIEVARGLFPKYSEGEEVIDPFINIPRDNDNYDYETKFIESDGLFDVYALIGIPKKKVSEYLDSKTIIGSPYNNSIEDNIRNKEYRKENLDNNDNKKDSNVGLEKDQNAGLEKDQNTSLEKDPNTGLEKDPNTDLEKDPNSRLKKDPNAGLKKEQNTVLEKDSIINDAPKISNMIRVTRKTRVTPLVPALLITMGLILNAPGCRKYRNKIDVEKYIKRKIDTTIVAKNYEEEEIDENINEQLVDNVNEQQVDHINEELVEHINEGIKLNYDNFDVISNIRMGGMYTVDEPRDYYNSSFQAFDNKDPKQFGTKHQFGEYEVTGFSFITKDRQLFYIENFDGKPLDITYSEFVKQTCVENNINPEDIVEFLIHLGKGETRTGWIIITDEVQILILNNENEILHEKTEQTNDDIKLVNGISNDNIKQVNINQNNNSNNNSNDNKEYRVKDKNFTGDSIVIEEDGEKVLVPIMDENGEFYKVGDEVIGSNGKTYTIIRTKHRDKTKLMFIRSREKVDNNQNMLGINLSIGSIIALLYLGTLFLNSIDNNHPKIYDFKSQKELNNYLYYIRKNLENKIQNQTTAEKILSLLVFSYDAVQRLTEEQREQIFNIIKNINSHQYKYELGDDIIFKGEDIIVVKANGEEYNIRSLINNKINDIGRHNPVIDTGEHKYYPPKENDNLNNVGPSR